MRKLLLFLMMLNVVSCSTSKIDNTNYLTNTNFKDLKIAKVSKIIETDTVIFKELRFYKIYSALDTMKSMYIDFGTWNNQNSGLHQDNISRKVWDKINLFENDEVFTIIADGTETKNDYFACLIVLDSKGKNCFEENHPYKNKIINLFHEKMKENRRKEINYLIF